MPLKKDPTPSKPNPEKYEFIGAMSLYFDNLKCVTKYCGDNMENILAAMKGNYLTYQMIKTLDQKVQIGDIYIRTTSKGIVTHLTENDLKDN